jgi:hypothetical protein
MYFIFLMYPFPQLSPSPYFFLFPSQNDIWQLFHVIVSFILGKAIFSHLGIKGLYFINHLEHGFFSFNFVM